MAIMTCYPDLIARNALPRCRHQSRCFEGLFNGFYTMRAKRCRDWGPIETGTPAAGSEAV